MLQSRLAVLALVLGSLAGSAVAQTKPPQTAPAAQPAAPAQPPAAWRVECGGDGKVLECRALETMYQNQNGQQHPFAQFIAQLGADKAPVMVMILPLGISLTEPVQVKIDNGALEKYSVQTCANNGCLVTVPLKEPMLAALRAGTILHVVLQDANKHTFNVEVPLLGFGLAFDKATR